MPAEPKEESDFSDVRGQALVKCALEVEAAGAHNVLLVGPRGSDKTTLAKRLLTLLLPGPARRARRPFRSPHPSISNAGLIAGWGAWLGTTRGTTVASSPPDGEVSLTHHGVVFLDELPEFRRDAVYMSRQRLDQGSCYPGLGSVCSSVLTLTQQPRTAARLLGADQYSCRRDAGILLPVRIRE